MMKKIFYWAMVAGVVLASCSKSEEIVSPEKEQVVQIKVKKAGVYTKNSNASVNGNDANDNKINTLEIFLFKSNGALESYKKYTAEQITAAGGLTNLEIKSTAGEKNIYVIANSKVDNWTGYITETNFLGRAINLSSENYENFTMSGSTTTTITGAGSVEITISRLVARVIVTDIATEFTGTPYQGQELRDVKLYLANVHGSKNYMGTGFASPTILNNGGYVAADNSSLAISNMLYDSLMDDIDDDNPYTTDHYFYCFENQTSEETSSLKFTRLILEAKLNGQKYYYPVEINQEGFGYVSANAHYGVRRNTSYSFAFKITGPGVLDPVDKLINYTLTVNTSVAGWSGASDYTVRF